MIIFNQYHNLQYLLGKSFPIMQQKPSGYIFRTFWQLLMNTLKDSLNNGDILGMRLRKIKKILKIKEELYRGKVSQGKKAGIPMSDSTESSGLGRMLNSVPQGAIALWPLYQGISNPENVTIHNLCRSSTSDSCEWVK